MTRRRPASGRARGEAGDWDDQRAPAEPGVPGDAAEPPVDLEVAELYADDSRALARWKARVTQYVDAQATLDALRLRPATEPPWPGADNPMLGYLVDRSAEIAALDGLDTALAWLAANSWLEGAIAERSRFLRLLDAD